MEKMIENQINQITSKIKKLKARNLRLETENEDLKKSVFGYLQQLEDQKKETGKIAQSVQNNLIGRSLMADKKTLQKEIDKYILMIDKCIAAVNTKI